MKKDWYKIHIWLMIGLTSLCIIIFTALSITYNDLTYVYSMITTIPIAWCLTLFYFLLNKFIHFEKSRKELNKPRMITGYIFLFLLKSIILFIPLIVFLVLDLSNINGLNVYAIIGSSFIYPISWFIASLFSSSNSNSAKGGGSN